MMFDLKAKHTRYGYPICEVQQNRKLFKYSFIVDRIIRVQNLQQRYAQHPDDWMAQNPKSNILN